MSTPLTFSEAAALPSSLRLASFNACGLTDARLDFCAKLMAQHRIDILLVQETFWPVSTVVASKPPSLLTHLAFRGNPVHRKRKRTATPHGLAVLLGTRLLLLRSQIRVVHTDEVSRSTISISVGRVQVTTVYFPPSMTTEQWTSALLAIPDAPSEGIIHVLLGDWNVRLGELTEDSNTNARTPHFMKIVQSRGLSLVPFASPVPTFSNQRNWSSTPDFVLVASRHLSTCSAVTVLDQSNGKSDHFPIMVDVTCRDAPSSPLNPEASTLLNPRQIATHLLDRDPFIRRSYPKEANSSLRGLLSRCKRRWVRMRGNPQAKTVVAQGLLDDLTDSFLSTLITIAEKYCGSRRRNQGPSKSARCGNTVIADLREQRVLLQNQLQSTSLSEDVRFPLQNSLRHVERKLAKREKVLFRQNQQNFFSDFEAKPLHEQQRMIRFERNKSQRSGAKMLNPKLLPEYSRHFASMFDFRADFVYGESSTTTAAAPSPLNEKVCILSETEFGEISPFFSQVILQQFVQREKCGKAAGCSGVSAELMKPVAAAVAAVLSLMAEIMYCTGLCPEAFTKSNVLPVPKKTNSSDIKDFRPISLTEVPRRIIEKCLALLLKPFEQRLSPMQGGFREHRSTLDQAAVLQQVMTTRYKESKPTLVAFLDIKAAYDSVDRQLLWTGCRRAGISDHVIRMLSGMFDNNVSRVVVDGSVGAWFRNHIGLMQGSSLSPFLYALFIDDLPKRLLSEFPSLPLGNSQVNSILYADDIALLADSPGTMQNMLDCCSQFALANHFHWGTQKCELLPSLLPVPLQPLSLQNESLKVTTSFKYLGIFFNEHGIDTDACVDRLGKSIEKAAAALAAMGFEPRHCPLHIIAIHFRVFVRSCGEYALAILPLNSTHLKKLEEFQYRGVKLLLKVRAKVSMVKLLACLGLETMSVRFDVLSAKWLHDVIHHKTDEFLVRQAWIDFSGQSLQQSKSSSFYYPSNKNPLTAAFDQSTHDHSLNTNGNNLK